MTGKKDSQKKRGNRKDGEEVFSVVNNSGEKLTPQLQENFIVCLKVPRTLFQKLFGKSDAYDSDVSSSSSSDILTKRCPLHDIYPEITLELEPETVVFNDYKKVNLNLINQHLDNHNVYKKVSLILPTFESGWPETSPFVCWNCTEKFEVPPVGLPHAHETRQGVEYLMSGNFCSYNCAARYLFDRENGNDLWQRYDLLNLIYNQINPSPTVQKIELAPPPLTLKKFGGKLTIAEYRSAGQDNRNYQLFKFPLKPCLYLLEETRPAKKEKEYIPIDPSKIKTFENKYKLYRKTPIPSKSCSIQDCFIPMRNAQHNT